jgi:aromatic-L-amino-acid/L-tryptophan decarboxylase
VIDYRDWHVPLGRRFRALKLWWVLRSYGARGLRHHVGEHIALAHELGRRVDAHPDLELIAPVSFALACFRHTAGNAATDALAERVNASGSVYVTPSTIGDIRFIRVAIGQTGTTARDVERLWSLLSPRSG